MFQNEVPHPSNDLVCKEPLLFIYTSSGSVHNIKRLVQNVMCSVQGRATGNVTSLLSVMKLP